MTGKAYLLPVNIAETQGSVPLLKEDRAHLKQVFRTRLTIFAAGYAFFTGFLLDILAPYGRMSEQELARSAGKGADFDLFGHHLTQLDIFWCLLVAFGLPTFLTGTVVFYRKIYCFHRDLRYGNKDPVRFRVINKLTFPLTGEYFLSLDDPRYLHYEVEADVYGQVTIGDCIELFRCRYSGHVFEKDYRFTLL